MDITLVGHTYKGATPVRSVYGDGSLALTLEDAHGEDVATVSAWLEVPASDGCIWVKDYSENEGMLDQMLAAGVVKATGRVATSGFVTLQEAQVLV